MDTLLAALLFGAQVTAKEVFRGRASGSLQGWNKCVTKHSMEGHSQGGREATLGQVGPHICLPASLERKGCAAELSTAPKLQESR